MQYAFPIPSLESAINFSRHWLRNFFFCSLQLGSGIQALKLGGGRPIFDIMHYIQVYKLYYRLDFKADIMPLARAQKSFQDIRRRRPDNKPRLDNKKFRAN